MFPAPTVARRVTTLFLTLLTAGLLAGIALVGSAGAASAADGYRYWNYSHLKQGSFEFAETGPGDYTPEDGAVEGWRYGTSTVKQGLEPRVDQSEVDFDAVCGDNEAADGEKRVAVLIDYGIPADAEGADIPDPRAECAVVAKAATGQQVLESVADVRGDQGMICALDGYPAKGCGTPVADANVPTDEDAVAFTLPSSADTAPAAAESDSGMSWPLVAVIAAVVVLALVAVPLYRRNRDA